MMAIDQVSALWLISIVEVGMLEASMMVVVAEEEGEGLLAHLLP
jgi:hypothetical protein